MHRSALPLLFSLGLVVATASPVLAADIAVEDRGEATRIIIPLAAKSGWTIRKGERSIHLSTLNGENALTGPSIPDEGRLSAIDVWRGKTETGISIHFTCDCRSKYSYGKGGIVIVDIAESGKPAIVAASRTLPETAQAVVSQPLPPLTAPTKAPDAPAPEQKARPILPASTTQRKLTPPPYRPPFMLAAPFPRAKPRVTIHRDVDADQITESEDEAIDALRDIVLSKLALGVEQGRITMDSGADRARKAYVPAGCPDEAALDLKRLTGTDDFRSAIPGLRADVYDEMKQVNPAAVRNLARHFLAFGLGPEARNVLDAFRIKGTPERLIRDMARVLEGEGADLSESLLLKPGCGARAAVWRAMVAAEKQDGTVREIYEQAGSTIFDVPGPLRKILGARIALGLIDEDDRETAMRLWRNLQTANGPRTPEMRLLAAYAVEGSPLNYLLALSETRSLAAREAAIRAADILLQDGSEIQAKRLGVTLDDLAFIYRDSPQEASLSLALTGLEARYGTLATALTLLADKAEEQPERAEHWRGVARDTIRVATEQADPVARPLDFDTILASLRYLDDSPSSDAAKFSLVRKLMNVGGAPIVESILKPDILKRSSEAKRLMAEAKLQMGDAAGAQKLLKGLTDENSDALRERVAEATGSNTADAARALFDPVATSPTGASLTTARDLMDEAETDLSIIEELLADG